MPRIWIFLCLFMGMTCSGQAVAQSGCNTDRIRTQLQTSERFPDLRGCRPDNVRQLLQNHDYGLEIENRVESRTYREGRIVSQRLDDGYVFVDVSNGPGPQRDRDVVVGIIEGVSRIISSRPPPSQRPPASEPSPERPPPPAPDQRLIDVMTIPAAPPPVVETPPPARPAPPVLPPVTERIPSPAPAPAPVESAPPTDQRGAQVPGRPADPAPAPQPTGPAPPPATDTQSPQIDPAIPPPAVPQPPVPPEVVRPAPSRFVIEGRPSAKEGDELLLVIRREGRDEIGHRLELGYSDPSLLVSPPTSIEFGAAMADEFTLRLRTAVTEDDGDHRLIVRLASADAEVRQPDSVTAVILDRTPWWEKLLEALASIPVWAVALAGSAAAAGLGIYLIPRATCSIEGGSLGWGARRPRSGWPEAHAEIVMGKPLFSVPSPLSLRRREDVQPSPT